ncbi:sensor domain-containing diguanylate cyclase [Clostridium sp. Sa3CUN1]|uniref:Sensor domain-containing diguanylate cyclase n=1 Tax=Clostridium gallinarum TaxID=2762246 RepID=A0ABR8Q706_9CLOT|nr:sensor domain-containing diguanylate cyclase [Clostridium gallinarum]MBD7916059.1 sensor domain-containing diguanylate cyclase [Clostridium gallinarum]
MDDYKVKYKQIKSEYESYQKITEGKIQELSSINVQYEKSLDMLSNVILISNYINSNLSSKNIIPMINDMIIGIIGVTQSTIYLQEDGEFVIKATNGTKESIALNDECIQYIKEHKAFILNSKEAITKDEQNGIYIRSRIGVPIKVAEKFIGYIVVDHTHYNFLTEFHENFLNSIAGQIAIALENSILYNKIEKAAKCDALIGIYNRKTFYEIVNERVENDNVNEYGIAMIDLDDFKKINDTLGHQFGDKVLIETANLIKSMLGPKDIIARYGGEEIILYIDCTKDISDVYKRIDSIREALYKNYISNGEIKKNITASFGLGFYPYDGNTLETVINCADKYLYKAKHAGKNKVMSTHFFR